MSGHRRPPKVALSITPELVARFFDNSTMSITPILHQINISLDDTRIEIEENGVYRITKRSLTGIGTHTKWFYTGEPESERDEGMGTASNEDDGRVVSFAGHSSFNSCIDGTLSAISSRETTPEPEVVRTDGEEFGEIELRAYSSDATEIVDEDLEAARFWRSKMKEEPLPDLPYERIMMKISQEPTVVLEGGI